MGHGYKVRCNNCDYEKDFYLGIGSEDYYLSEELIERYFRSKLMKQAIREQINTGYQPKQFERLLFKCPKCYRVYERLSVIFGEASPYSYETVYQCPKCKKKLQHAAEEELENSTCPRCHQKSLKICGFIMWD